MDQRVVRIELDIEVGRDPVRGWLQPTPFSTADGSKKTDFRDR